MSQIYAPTRAGKAAMFKAARIKALANGDLNMVRNLDCELAACGIFETTLPAEEMEQAVPEKPRRGRKPLPRCEHGMILLRCPECSPEEVLT